MDINSELDKLNPKIRESVENQIAELIGNVQKMHCDHPLAVIYTNPGDVNMYARKNGTWHAHESNPFRMRAPLYRVVCNSCSINSGVYKTWGELPEWARDLIKECEDTWQK